MEITMSDVKENLNQIFNTTFVPESNSYEVIEEKPPMLPAVVQPTVEDESIEEDFQKSRGTLNDLIDQGSEAVTGIMELAKESQHPRAYEVAATLINTVAGVTEKLMLLQKNKKELTKKPEATPTGDINIDKAVFVGTTADLLKKKLDEKKQGK